jgi:hypothetical protein
VLEDEAGRGGVDPDREQPARFNAVCGGRQVVVGGALIAVLEDLDADDQ